MSLMLENIDQVVDHKSRSAHGESYGVEILRGTHVWKFEPPTLISISGGEELPFHLGTLTSSLAQVVP